MNEPHLRYRTRYGATNPEFVQNDMWTIAASKDWTGYNLRQHLRYELTNNHFRKDFSNSSFRESVPGPFWSWERFGRTSTALPDGRIIHVAGEHEDGYDPDFCIYNDVVVEYPGGQREFYLYPKDIFPPTDFHTATLFGSGIILIGSLGYKDMRRPGTTQVLRLDTRTLEISTIATTGDGPGWISRHRAEKIDDNVILIVGGKVQSLVDYVDNTAIFELDLRTMQWSRRKHGDVAVFPVSAEQYQQLKSPAFGTANPELITNPFWLEMAKRRWPPSRARLHFADMAPPEPEMEITGSSNFEQMPAPGTPAFDVWIASSSLQTSRNKLVRHREDTIWASRRRDSARVVLNDGRRLVIGGSIGDYGEEYADPWTYNDIVATDAEDNVTIFAYPREVFPQLYSPVAISYNEDVLIMGIRDRYLHRERTNQFSIVRLNTLDFKITPLPIEQPKDFRLNIYPGCCVRRENLAVFPNVRMTSDNQQLGIALNLNTLTWSEPFPHECPASTEDE